MSNVISNRPTPALKPISQSPPTPKPVPASQQHIIQNAEKAAKKDAQDLVSEVLENRMIQGIAALAVVGIGSYFTGINPLGPLSKWLNQPRIGEDQQILSKLGQHFKNAVDGTASILSILGKSATGAAQAANDVKNHAFDITNSVAQIAGLKEISIHIPPKPPS